MRYSFKKILCGLLLVLLLLPLACDERSAEPAPSTAAASQTRTFLASEIHVSDGDTVTAGGDRVRLLGIDCPETAHPGRFDSAQEPEGTKATKYLKKLLAAAHEVEIEFAKRPDQYGRRLGYLIADGKNLNAEMVRAGHAWETISFYGKNGLPDRAAEVKAAAVKAGNPSFERPSLWRKKHSK